MTLDPKTHDQQQRPTHIPIIINNIIQRGIRKLNRDWMSGAE